MPPAGYKRSRALWDETRRPEATPLAYVRAIMYELQPIRLSKTNQRQFVLFLRKVASTLIVVLRSIPGVVVAIFKFLRTLKLQHWLAIGGIVLYYYFVRFMHELLLAGPVIVIATALSLIFTVGLGDNKDRDGLSAYAVFNRGFERLLGSVDAEALMAQHVGGGLGGGGMMGGLPPRNEDDAERDRGVARRRRPNRANPNNNNNNDNERNNNDAVANDNNNNRPRKSGKKARRRDLEQRREIQNQREAAAALGMPMGHEAMEEQVAMQRLIEEHVAAENRNEE